MEKYDNLPKTICEDCISRLEVQFNLLQKIKESETIHRTHTLLHVCIKHIFILFNI